MWENVTNNPENLNYIDETLFLLTEKLNENIDWSLQFSNFLDDKNNTEELATFFAENLLPDVQNIMYS